ELEGERSATDRRERGDEAIDLEHDLVIGLTVVDRVDVDTEDGRERVQAAGAALAVEPRTSSEAEVQGRGGVTRGLLDVVAVLRDFTDFSAVVARGAGVAVEFSGAARESGGAHAAFGVEAVDAVDVELFTDGTADEVLDRDAARDAERVL